MSLSMVGVIILTSGMLSLTNYGAIYVFLLVLFLLFSYQYSLNKNIVFLNVHRKRLFYVTLFEKIARFGFPIIFYAVGQSLQALLMGLVVGYGILFLVTQYLAGVNRFKIRFYKRKAKIYLLYAWPIMIASMCSWGVSFSDRYFISYFLDKADVGIYSVVAQFAGFGMLFAGVFSLYVNPLLYKKFASNKTEALTFLQKMLRYLALSMAILFVAFLFIPRQLIAFILSEQIAGNETLYHILIILLLASLFNVYLTALSLYYTLSKKLQFLAICWIFGIIINFIGNIFIQSYGLLAAAISTLFSHFMIVVLMHIILSVSRPIKMGHSK